MKGFLKFCSSVRAAVGCTSVSVPGVAERARAQAAGTGYLLLIVRVLTFRYWCALACVSVIESAAGPQRFPGYHHAKLLLLLWLQSARYQGAARLYRLLLRPALEKLRPSMEAFLARAAALAVRTCTSFCALAACAGLSGSLPAYTVRPFRP